MKRRVFGLLCLWGLGLYGCGGDGGSGDNNTQNNNNTMVGFCGDGVVDPGEECDNGAQNSDIDPDACRTNCRLAHCGDGVVDTGEFCDDGDDGTNMSDTCPNTCQEPECGDGHVLAGVEECDDGNTEDGDDCRGDCLQDMTLCGNGTVDPGEECDSASANSDTIADRCRTNCQFPKCGDGVIDTGEVCDGLDLGDTTCTDLTPSDGVLVCSPECTFDTSGCSAPIWIPLTGNTYWMGSGMGDSTKPIHEVAVPGFEMTRTEVTVRQYGACVTAESCTAPNTSESCNWNDSGFENHPVNCVSWDQAKAFCAWAGGRLPSESEWEYAARSEGQGNISPWGNEEASCDQVVMANDDGWGCGTQRTWAVCSKTSGNTFQGLCDMAGNVWEWVEDDRHDDYTGAPTDGSAWVEDPRDSHRVIRGGGFTNSNPQLRTAFRYMRETTEQYPDQGFRCAR